MTLAELLDVPIDVIEKLTDDELNKICEPFFNITRPELAKKERQQTLNIATQVRKTMSPEERQKQMQIEIAKSLARKMGIGLR